MAIINIKHAGIQSSEQYGPFLELLLNDFSWKVSSEHRSNDRRFREIQAGWSSIPGLYPILDPFAWPEVYDVCGVDPLFSTWILWGAPTGFYFYIDEVMYNVGTSLAKFLEGLYTVQYALEDQTEWEKLDPVDEDWNEEDWRSLTPFNMSD